MREVGIGLQSDKTLQEYAEIARAADEGGVDVISVFSDLMFQPPLPALLEMARATERVRLGFSCLNPYTMVPHEIAGQVAMLDIASGGRAFLGLARGAWLEDVGLSQDHPLPHLAECWEVVRRLISGDTAGFTGEHFQLAPSVGLRYSRQRKAIPLLVGSWGPKTLAWAGATADEVKLGGSANPALVKWARERVAAGANSVGRNPDEIGIVVGAVSVIDEDGQAARAKARDEVAMYLDVVASLDPTIDLERGSSSLAGGDISDEVLDLFSMSGTPETVAEHMETLYSAGATRVELGTPQGLRSTKGGIEIIVDRLLPLVSDAATSQG